MCEFYIFLQSKYYLYMKQKINTLKKSLENMQNKVVEVTKTHYTLENKDVFEHTFEIDENINVGEFQKMLDNAKSVVLETINKIENDELD